jgi:hypothetical protein
MDISWSRDSKEETNEANSTNGYTISYDALEIILSIRLFDIVGNSRTVHSLKLLVLMAFDGIHSYGRKTTENKKQPLRESISIEDIVIAAIYNHF